MKVVIIEDEIITARDLRKTIVSVAPEVEVAAMLHTIDDSVDYLRNHPEPDLIFSDIRLGDGLSFEIFKKISKSIPIVFCTAYNTYYTEAFQATGIDYILKPFGKSSVEKALRKYQSLQQNFSKKEGEFKNLLVLLEERLNLKNKAVLIRRSEKIIPLDIADIAFFYIEKGCNYAYTFSQEKHLINDNLEELEKAVGDLFFRVNRQFLINRKSVKDADHYFDRKIIINLVFPFKEKIILGKMKTSHFFDWLKHS